jgi:uncharacterized protein (TIGR03118 family)
MKKAIPLTSFVFSSISLFLITCIMVMTSCNLDESATPGVSYEQVNLVGDVSSMGAAKTDPNLVNAWGMAVCPTGAIWISSTEKELTTVYDRIGTKLLEPVTVEGEPTGVVYNPTTAFVIPGTSLVSKLIYVGEDGTVQAWNSGMNTVEVANNEGAVYKGVAIANTGKSNFLYIANFSEGEIEVLDRNFVYVEGIKFEDPTIPAGFAPFNIQNIGGKLYVTYAKQSADKYDDVSGAGNGYVNIFNPDGTLVKRFASQGTLNSPWGMVKAPDGFQQGDDAILVGNFGDGRINVFSKDGDYMGQLKDGDVTISIDGLWALLFPVNGVPSGDQNQLFFTAGPDDEQHGLFGYLHLH